MDSTAIIQWNCRGYRSRYEEIREIIKENKPACICLQETMMGNETPVSPRGYNMEAFSPVDNPVPGSGIATLIRNDIKYHPVQLNTQLQTRAFRINIGKMITVCNIYISPNERITAHDVLNLVQNLPSPFLIIGDLNAKHHLWVIQKLILMAEL